jgi:hypothetical protein
VRFPLRTSSATMSRMKSEGTFSVDEVMVVADFSRERPADQRRARG